MIAQHPSESRRRVSNDHTSTRIDEEELADLLMKYSYLTKKPGEAPFILASGKTSPHYFDCERTSTFATALPLIAKAFYRRLVPGVVCVGGPTRGADPIADCIAYYSVIDGHPRNVFSVRKEFKTHGIEGWIEGSAHRGDQVAFVDDVVTSGKSVIEALEKCSEAGLQVVQVMVLVDREEQGGLQRIRDFVGADVPVEAIFSYANLIRRVSTGA